MRDRRRAAIRLRHRRTGPTGFGLLEAIVALALLAGSGIALFGWIEQSLQTATRLRRADQEARLTLAAQALVETVNPLEQTDGSMQVSGLTVRWTGELVEPLRRNSTFAPDVPGAWQVGLYRLRVSADEEATAMHIEFVQLRTGLRRLPQGESAP